MFLIVHGTAFDIKTDKLMHEHVLEIFVYYTALHGNMKQKKIVNDFTQILCVQPLDNKDFKF